MNYDHEYEDRYEDADQYEGEDGESDDEEEVAALGDAMELNQKLKQIMSSDLDPIAMQEQLNALMGGMNINMDTSQNHSQQRQQQQPRQQQRMVEGGKQSRKPLNNGMSHNNMRKAMKSTNSGKTFSNQEQVAQARNNQRLLQKMIAIQTQGGGTSRAGSGSIGGYQASNSRTAITNFKSSNSINRKKKQQKVAGENQKFLQRLQNVKSTMNTKKMRQDADRNAQISRMRSQVHVAPKRRAERRNEPGSNNVFGNSANRARMSKFREPPSIKQPAWES